MKLKYLLSGLAAFLVLAACDDVPEPVPALTLKTRTVEFAASEGSSVLPVECTVGWTATVDSASVSWLSAEKKNDELLLSVAANESLKEREGSVTVAAGPKTVLVSVYQDGIVVSAKASKDTVSFLVAGGSVTLDVDASVDWRFDTSDDWIVPDKERGAAGKSTITLTVAANDNYVAKNGKITFNYGMKVLSTVVVMQDPFVVVTSLDKKSFEAPTAGGSESVSYTSNYAWKATADSWITVAPASGEASDAAQAVSVTFDEASALERNGKVIFIAGNVKDTILVHQDKASAKPIEMVLDFWDASTNKHNSKLVFKEALISSSASAKNLGVKTFTLVNYPYTVEYYASYLGPLINSTSGLMSYVGIVSGNTSNAIRATEGFAYIKFPAIAGFKLDKVVIKTPATASTQKFPSYITSTYGNSNEEAKAAALTPVVDMARDSTVEYILTGSAANTAYYLFMEPNGGTSQTYAYTISCITLTYNPA